MSEAAFDHITPSDAVLARLALWLQDADTRSRRALNAPAHQQREELATILGSLALLLQDVFADKHPTEAFLVRAAYGILAINTGQPDALFKPQQRKAGQHALPAHAELHAHLALPIAVLHKDGGDLPVPEAALAVATELKKADFRPRQGRRAGKLISKEQLASWYYAAEGGYAAVETVTAYRKAKKQMLRAHPDYESWTRKQRLAWMQEYVADLTRIAALF